MRKRTKLSLLAVVALLTGVIPITGARAQNTYEVPIGQFVSPVGESMRFFPQSIQVHQGDVLNFTTEGFHNALLLPASEDDVDAWIAANATGPTAPWSFISLDPDDGAAAAKFNNAVLFPTDPTCGGAGQPACVYDGTSIHGSGLPLAGPLDWSVEVQAAPGEDFWILCNVHTAMRMHVEVVPDDQPASDPAELAAEMEQQLEDDAQRAERLDNRLSKPKSKKQGNHRVWQAYAGYDTDTLALYAFYPRRLRVERGDRVNWSFANLHFEDHTVTGPNKKALPLAEIAPGCDPDGDGPGPDTPPEIPDPPFCNDPTQLEFDIDEDFILPAGDGKVKSPNDFENSGVAGSNFGGPDNYKLKFGKKLNKPYKYLCLIHPFMRGRVAVK
jgi:plastocyanin